MIKPLWSKFRFAALLSILTFLLISSSPLNDPLERIVFSFQRYLSETPQEKVYLHTDRPYYAAGETVWFKAYLTEGPYHEASSLSATIYAELIDEEGNILKQLKLFSPEGFASGYLSLPDSLPSGNYLLRAYSNWMRNAGEDYFFHKSIKILNTQIPPPEQVSQGGLDIQFFPEGGNLVDDIMSKVAFKAIGADGSGKVVKGKILEDELVVASFESNHLGMGIFPLIPKKGKRYKALLDNTDFEAHLPLSQEAGIVMAVTNSPASSDVTIKIQSSDAILFKSIHLLAQTRGIVCASSEVDLSRRVAFVKIPKTAFHSGIAQLTALDHEGNPLAERLVFIDHQDALQISISSEMAIYSPRDSVRIEIETKDKDGLPLMANLSMTVFDSGQIDIDENKETIQSNLLISSELKGHIESPGYYFNPKNEDRLAALDILMLTQGWRKFTIKQALKQEISKPTYRVEKGLTVRGQLHDKNGLPISEGTVSYLSLYPITQSITTSSAANGEFELHDLIFFDSAQVSLQGKSKNGRTPVEVSVDTDYEFPPILLPVVLKLNRLSILESGFLQKAEERKAIDKAFDIQASEISLNEVQVKGKRISEIEGYTGPRIYGNGSAKIQVAGNIGLENQQHPLELVRGRVAGVQVSGGGADWRVLIQGVGSINSALEPLIMVNDIPIDFKSLNSLPIHEIDSYTVWKGPDTAIFGARGANGVIGFYTKRSAGTSSPPKAEIPRFPVAGYQIEREFYAPKYPVSARVQPKPDRRVTLFWAPVIQTDSSGKASVTFYNHDLETTIICEIEGIGRNGNPRTARFQYKIEKE